MSAPRTIAIVEDDAEIRRLVAAMLEREGFTVVALPDGAALDAQLARGQPDLLILDLMLPGEDGLSICRRLRVESRLPILMLTARSEDIDRIVGLEIGADDYLAKPFNNRELLARIPGAVATVGHEPGRSRPDPVGLWPFVADFDRRVVMQGDRPIRLTSAEFELLGCFLRRPGRVLSRDQLLGWVHGRETGVFDRSVDMAVSRLRSKLGDDQGAGERLIATVRNAGYVFTGAVTKC